MMDLLIRLLLLAMAATMAPACSAEAGPEPGFTVRHEAELHPEHSVATARLVLEQAAAAVRTFDFNAPTGRYQEFSGDGEIRREGERLIWQPPATGGELRYRVTIDSRRGEAFDARITQRWALLRLDDLFPAARVRLAAGASGRSSLALNAPAGWSVVTPIC